MVLEERLDPTSLDWRNFIAAEEDSAIVGIAQVKPYRDCREFGSLVVLPSHRERGIGAMLIEAALAKEQGDVYLLCQQIRVPYYRKFGFELIDERDAPGTLKRKLRFSKFFRIFGVRIVCMKRST
jgi:N-acetylglutamate synthase-like GNAT family acetyltransferase